jgi:U4/U6 small nuclear ribonucleoprotein PRP4
MDALGRVWDLRTGRCVYVMKGHVKQVLAIDFHPDWCAFLTGKEIAPARSAPHRAVCFRKV